MTIDQVRAVADAVLYEGYLLYPYRATSGKNQLRWQFGVLGPQGAEQAGLGEGSSLSMQCLVKSRPEPVESHPEPVEGSITITVRFLQVQQRRTQTLDDHGGFVEVPELRVDGDRWFAWDEAIEIEQSRIIDVGQLIDGHSWDVLAEAGEVLDALETLIRRINRTNAATVIEGGTLTGKYRDKAAVTRYGDASEEELRRGDAVVALAQEIGRTSAQVAINWVRQRPLVGAPIIPILGARSVAQLRDNLGALDFSLTAEQLSQLDGIDPIKLGFPHDFLRSDNVKNMIFGAIFELTDNHRG